MKTAYDLSLELIVIIADIDRTLDSKSKSKDIVIIERLDREMDKLEIRMYEIKNVLKGIQVW